MTTFVFQYEFYPRFNKSSKNKNTGVMVNSIPLLYNYMLLFLVANLCGTSSKSTARKLYMRSSTSVKINHGNAIRCFESKLDSLPSSLETCFRQFERLLDANGGMKPSEKFSRIGLSLILLVGSKAIGLMSPILFRSLIYSEDLVNYTVKNVYLTTSFKLSLLGIILGMGISKITAGLVQVLSEFIISPVTVSTAAILPASAFSGILSSSSKRMDEGSIFKMNISANYRGNNDIIGKESRAGFARQALDRGLRSSNFLLYKSIFQLLPPFLESLLVIYLIYTKIGIFVGITAAVVAYGFVTISALLMGSRIRYIRAQIREEGSANSVAEDAISLAETVVAYGSVELEVQKYRSALQRVTNTTITRVNAFSMVKFYQNIFVGIGTMAITYATIASIKSHTLSITNPMQTNVNSLVASQLILVQALFAQLWTPLDQVTLIIRDCLNHIEDIRALQGFAMRRKPTSLSSPTQMPQHTITMRKADHPSLQTSNQSLVIPGGCSEDIELDANNSTASVVVARENQSITPSRNTSSALIPPPLLELRNISFAYSSSDSPEKRILRELSLEIPSRGYAVGVVGPSGSGKSTLIRILIGLEDLIKDDVVDVGTKVESSNQGQILLNGIEITNMSRTNLFSYVGQDNDLFSTLNIQENILYGLTCNSPANTVVVNKALQQSIYDAHLQPVIDATEGGLSASVGPRGRKLSGGERQRVCIARALCREYVTGGALVFDEATSALDAQTEDIIIRRLRDRIGDGSVAIIVSHKMTTIQHCDHILVLKQGTVTENGSHEKLIQSGGWYSRTWQLQNSITA